MNQQLFCVELRWFGGLTEPGGVQATFFDSIVVCSSCVGMVSRYDAAVNSAAAAPTPDSVSACLA
jgi:hypothetical protein